MPNFTEAELKVVLAKARVLGCTHYTKSGSGGIYLLDQDQMLTAFAKPGHKLWVAKFRNHKIDDGQLGELKNLRKRYECKHSSRTSEGAD